jgi:membrane protein
MRALQLPKDVVFKFLGDNCPQQAAALAFYTFFSLPPLLFLLLMLLGVVLDPGTAADRIHTEMVGLVGTAAADQIGAMLEAAQDAERAGGVGAIVGLGALLFGATGAFAQLQGSLNHVFRVQPDPARGDVRNFLTKRVLSFAMVLTLAFLLLVSLAMGAAMSALGDFAGRALPEGLTQTLFLVVQHLVDFAVTVALFALMYRVLPDAEFAWRDVGVGAVATALLFVAGKFAIGFYLGQADIGTSYGAAGSLALVMIWVYYSAMVLLGGAVFTYVWAERKGSGVRPEPGAVQVHVEKQRPAEPDER